MLRLLIALATVVAFCGLPDSAYAQDSRRLTIVFGTINQGALGEANKAFAAGAEMFGSYRAYVDGQDVGRVPYGRTTSFFINSSANAFTLWEHQPLEKKSVSNTVNINAVGRSRNLFGESVQSIFIFCTNTQTFNFQCDALSESDVKRLILR